MGNLRKGYRLNLEGKEMYKQLGIK